MSIVKPNCFEKTKEAWGIFSFFSSTNVETKNVCPIAYNVLSLCVRAGFGVQNCQPATMPNRSTTHELTTSARMTQNECYMPPFLMVKIFFLILFVNSKT